MSVRKGWKIQTPRLQAKCPFCGRKHTVFMTSQANWKIHGVESTLDAAGGNFEAATSKSPTVVRGTKTSSTERTRDEAVDGSPTPQKPSLYSPADDGPEDDEGATRGDGA